MKIGLVCPYNLFKSGGVQECVIALQAELSRRGHNTLIITPAHSSMPKKLPKHLRVLGKSASVKSFHTTAQISASVDVSEVKKLLTEENFDILHFHEPWVPLLSRQLLTENNCKHIATFHAKLPETVMSNTIKKVVTPYTKSIIKKLDALTAVSPAAAEYVSELTHKPIKIIPNGVDIKKFNLPHKKNLQKNILFIGRLEKRKGVKYLLNAFSILGEKYPEVRLIIAGEGPYRQRLEDEARHLEIKNIKFLGYVSEAKKLDLLSQTDLFCSPAIHGESFGIVLLEGMAANVPIVAADNPGYQSVLTGHGLISLVNVKNRQEFARRLELMLFDSKIRQSWKAWAKQYVKQFDYPKVVDQYEKLYKNLVKK